MRQIQRKKRGTRNQPDPIDLRTPSGCLLRY